VADDLLTILFAGCLWFRYALVFSLSTHLKEAPCKQATSRFIGLVLVNDLLDSYGGGGSLLTTQSVHRPVITNR